MVSLYKKESDTISVHHYPEFPEWAEQDVKPLHIQLPTIESFFGVSWEEGIKKIDGYGLHPKDQYFENYRSMGYFTMPPKLQDLEIDVRKNLGKEENEAIYPEELFDELEEDPVKYAREIAWIKLQHKRMIQGYWCFIKGVPTYIDPWHYLYLMCFPIGNRKRKDRLPFFRQVDRKIFFFYKWAATTTEAEFNYVLYYRRGGELKRKYGNTLSELQSWGQKEAKVFWIEPLEPDERLVDVGHRLIYGVAFPKRRRVGGTSQGVTVLTANTLWYSMGGFAIQALTEETARDDVYKKKFLPMWRNLWFFFKPAHKRHIENKMQFVPRENVKLGKGIVPHGGWITPRSGENKAFDGNEVRSYLRDEPGKETRRNVGEDFADTIKNTLSYGEDIHGLAAFISTLGKFEEGGGEQFFDLIKNSLAHERSENGDTYSGLATLFVPAFDGYDRKIDIYGDPIILDPIEPVMNLEGDLVEEGALPYLLKKRKHYERAKKWNLYTTELRVNPFTIREAAMPENKNNSWDTSVIREVISDIRFGDPVGRYYKLKASDGMHFWDRPFTGGMSVVMEETIEEEGAWFITIEPNHERRNKREYDAYTRQWKPALAIMDDFVLGTDTIAAAKKFTTSESGLSKGGGHLFWKRDLSIDGDDVPTSHWKSHTTVGTYLSRPDDPREFAEQMLYAAILWGAMVNQERNYNIVAERFIEWGFGGYLIYPIDPVTNEMSKVPGTYTGPAVHQKMFELYSEYVKNHIRREKHLKFLEQILAVSSIEDITKNDLFAAGGMSFIGAGNRYTQVMQDSRPKISIGSLVSLYD